MIIAAEKSGNDKTGPCSATYAPRQTCPESCPLQKGGCYGRSGNVGLHVRRITEQARDKSPVQIAKAEAEAIDKLTGRRPLRLHVAGDCPNESSAKIVAQACERYRAKHGQPVWAFTHAWYGVPRESWRDVSILASCERPTQAILATEQGYATALITPIDKIAKYAKHLASKGVTPRLCRHFTHGEQCVECRLCLEAKPGTCVLLPPHGPVKTLLESIK